MTRRVRSSRFAIAIVTVTFAVASLTAYQVYNAVCAQEATAQRALRSYARFAAWTFAHRANTELDAAARRILQPVLALGPDVETLPEAQAVARGAEAARACRCVAMPDIQLAFRYDARTATLVAVDSSGVPRPASQPLEAAIGRLLQTTTVTSAGPNVVSLDADGRRLLIVFTMAPDCDGSPRALFGFVTDAGSVGRAVFATVFRGESLLPPVDAAGLPVDEALGLVVVDGRGREVFHSPSHSRVVPAVALAMRGGFEGLTVRAAMSPAFAERVVDGVWTWNRSQLVLGLITITAGLIVVSLLQLHREKQLARLRGNFVSSVSHELRTPLAQIRMFAEMLRLGWIRSDDERRRSVEIIDQEARRLSHLVENVLHFSRSERGGARIAHERLDLAVLTDEIAEAFSPLAAARGMTVRVTHDGRSLVLGDRDALRQIVINLLDNAAKYGPPGQTIDVSTGVLADGRARLTVDDQGAGISPRDRTRVWEAFERLDQAVREGVTGNGIGLSVVRELVTAHGGDVAIDDAPSGGARFIVILPAAAHEERPTRITPAPGTQLAPAMPARRERRTTTSV